MIKSINLLVIMLIKLNEKGKSKSSIHHRRLLKVIFYVFNFLSCPGSGGPDPLATAARFHGDRARSAKIRIVNGCLMNTGKRRHAGGLFKKAEGDGTLCVCKWSTISTLCILNCVKLLATQCFFRLQTVPGHRNA